LYLEWKVSPQGLIPTDILLDFLAKKPEAIQEAKDWVNRNGRIILFTKSKINGDEDIWVTDQGEIILRTKNHCKIPQLRILAFHTNMDVYRQVLALGQDLNEVINLLKKHEPLF